MEFLDEPTTPADMLAWIQRHGASYKYIKDEMDPIEAMLRRTIDTIRAYQRIRDVEFRYNRAERNRLLETVSTCLLESTRYGQTFPPATIEKMILVIQSVYARIGVDHDHFYQHDDDWMWMSPSLRDTYNVIHDYKLDPRVGGHMISLAKNLRAELIATEPRDILIMLSAPRVLKMRDADLARLPSELVRRVGEMLFGW